MKYRLCCLVKRVSICEECKEYFCVSHGDRHDIFVNMAGSYVRKEKDISLCDACKEKVLDAGYFLSRTLWPINV